MDKAKAEKAVAAMKAIGLPRKFVSSVLQEALEAYDGSWAFLEQDHFQLLADLCFDQMQEQDTLSIERGMPMQCSKGHQVESSRARSRRACSFKSQESCKPKAQKACKAGWKQSEPFPAKKNAPADAESRRDFSENVLEPFNLYPPLGLSPYDDFPYHLVAKRPAGHRSSKSRLLNPVPLALRESEPHQPLLLTWSSTVPDENKQLVPQIPQDKQLQERARGFDADAWALSLLRDHGDDDDN